MMFVTLGTQDKSFERLLKQIDKEIERGNIKEKVIVQAGHTKYESKNMEIFDLVSSEEFEEYMDACDILITHGGAGSILTGIKKKKKVIAAARLSKYKEHNNDHQKQIIKEFSDKGYILELRDFDKLGKVLEKARTFKPRKFVSNTDNMVKLVSDYIEECNHISWYNKSKEFIWYLFFGFITTVINLGVFMFLDKMRINLYLNNSIAWIVSVLFAFFTNKYFVFTSKLKKNMICEMGSFFLFRIISLAIEMFGLFIFIDIFDINKFFIKLVMCVVIVIVNYIFSKIFVFKKSNS